MFFSAFIETLSVSDLSNMVIIVASFSDSETKTSNVTILNPPLLPVFFDFTANLYLKSRHLSQRKVVFPNSPIMN